MVERIAKVLGKTIKGRIKNQLKNIMDKETIKIIIDEIEAKLADLSAEIEK